MTGKQKNKLKLSDRLSLSLKRAGGIKLETDLQPYQKVVDEIQKYDFKTCTDAALRDRAAGLKQRAADGEPLEVLLPPVFALAGEAAARTLGLRPYDVQLLAGVVMHHGGLAEMQTGEGKTLAAVFPACLAAMSEKGVHIMTANDYLARRDALWMKPVYDFFGLQTACVQETMNTDERKRAYAADVTYLTAKEAGFDFLRDGLCYDPEKIVQRDFHLAIVDEADFILIDEARIPLVLAGRSGQPSIDPTKIDTVIPALSPGTDYVVDKNRRSLFLTVLGQQRVQELLGCGGMHEEEHAPLFAAVFVALHAHALLARDVDYIVRNGKIELVDELTGRIAHNRRWPYGIQTALEAKEGLCIQPQGRIFGSITIEHFISLYPRLAAMTATAVSAAGEFSRCYHLATVIIPPNRPVARSDAPDLVFTTRQAKTKAIVAEIKQVHAAGRPVLVGTKSVRESEELAGLLARQKIPCRVLNAKNDEREAECVSGAGLLGAVTISTNMAGRGTDIKLGGEGGADREKILALGGLYIIGTNRHDSVRIDRQLRGRAGRQGDPGLSRFFISLEDPLFERYGVVEFLPGKYCNERESAADGSLSDRRVLKELVRAQSIIENQNAVLRRTLRRYSLPVEKQRQHLRLLRENALRRDMIPESLEVECLRHVRKISATAGSAAACRMLARIYLFYLDLFWADHLAEIDDVREGIHLHRYAGQEPLYEFIRIASEIFENGLRRVELQASTRFHQVPIAGEGFWDLEALGVRAPGSTWTYLLDDEPLPAFNLSLLAGGNIGFAVFAAAPLFLFRLIATGISTLAARVKRMAKKEGVSDRAPR